MFQACLPLALLIVRTFDSLLCARFANLCCSEGQHRHAATEDLRKRRQNEHAAPSNRKLKRPRRDQDDQREDEMDSEFESSQVR